MNDDSKIVDLAAAAKKRGRTLPGKPSASVQINGNNNVGVAGNRNHVEINVKTSPQKRPKISVQTGPEHITEAQAADIQELVAKVVHVSGMKFPFVWAKFKKKHHVASYRFLPRAKFEEARSYLRKWVASASSAAAVPGSTAERKRQLARIHAEAKKTPGALDRVREYALARFGMESLAELSPEQLQEVIRDFNF